MANSTHCVERDGWGTLTPFVSEPPYPQTTHYRELWSSYYDHGGILREDTRLKISQKGLYALQAMMTLGRQYGSETVKIRDIASDSDLPEKFLELILLELKNARIVESVRGAKGGYRLRRPPSEIHLSEIIRLLDGPLAPFGDADQLRSLIVTDADHRALYQVFLDVRDAAAKILESTTVADIISSRPRSGKHARVKRKQDKSSPPTIVESGGNS